MAAPDLDDPLATERVAVDPVACELVRELAVVRRLRLSLDAPRRVLGGGVVVVGVEEEAAGLHAINLKEPRGISSESARVAGNSAAFTGIDGQWRSCTSDDPEHEGHALMVARAVIAVRMRDRGR